MQRQNTLSMTGRVPPIPEAEIHGLVQHLGMEELTKLHDDEDQLLSVLQDMGQTKKLQQDCKLLIAANKSLAEYNLSLRSRLEEGRSHLASKSETAQELHEELMQHQSELESLTGAQSLDSVHAILKVKHAEADERAEELGSEFINGKVDVKEFLEEFVASKKLSHMRSVKVEKMSKLLTGEHTARDHVPQSYSSPQSSLPYPPTAGHNPVPYPPSNSYAMPKPTYGGSLLS